MNDAIELRPAHADEAGELSNIALRSKAYWGYSADFLAQCKEELTYHAEQIESEYLDFVVAEAGAAIIGFYALDACDADCCELEALFVEPAHIGLGVGRRLLRHAQQSTATKGANSLLIQSDPHAERFYLTAGGLRIGSRESSSIPGRMLPLYKISSGVAKT